MDRRRRIDNQGNAQPNPTSKNVQGTVTPTYTPPGYKRTKHSGKAEDKSQMTFDSGVDNGGRRGARKV